MCFNLVSFLLCDFCLRINISQARAVRVDLKLDRWAAPVPGSPPLRLDSATPGSARGCVYQQERARPTQSPWMALGGREEGHCMCQVG